MRDLAPGETVGYGNTWQAGTPARIATVSAGYADGLFRAMGNGLSLWADGVACPAVGRISMDLIGVDVTRLDHAPEHLEILNGTQTVDALARTAGTIGYEVLTALGGRYSRRYVGDRA